MAYPAALLSGFVVIADDVLLRLLRSCRDQRHFHKEQYIRI
jgi:hypothetical protein